MTANVIGEALQLIHPSPGNQHLRAFVAKAASNDLAHIAAARRPQHDCGFSGQTLHRQILLHQDARMLPARQNKGNCPKVQA
jgi:hypothetical protein